MFYLFFSYIQTYLHTYVDTYINIDEKKMSKQLYIERKERKNIFLNNESVEIDIKWNFKKIRLFLNTEFNFRLFNICFKRNQTLNMSYYWDNTVIHRILIALDVYDNILRPFANRDHNPNSLLKWLVAFHLAASEDAFFSDKNS